MEFLSSVGTIVKISQDLVGTASTVTRNKSRCRKLADRVKGIGDLLQELQPVAPPETMTDAASQRLLRRMEETLRRALQLVESCQRSSCPCRLIVAAGRIADRFDEVDSEINHCLLDMGLANRILLEKLLLHRNEAASSNAGGSSGAAAE